MSATEDLQARYENLLGAAHDLAKAGDVEKAERTLARAHALRDQIEASTSKRAAAAKLDRATADLKDVAAVLRAESLSVEEEEALDDLRRAVAALERLAPTLTTTQED